MSEIIDRHSGDTDARAGSSARASAPRVWLVVGEKRGDNAQIRNLARAVGWPFEEKMICMRPEWVDGKPPVRAVLDYIDVGRSDALDEPWPDLVMTAGRRLSSVALWIKQASGGRTRLVMIGKPRGHAADFDLIVAAGHYVMRDAPNVVRHALPLMQIDSETLVEAKKAWVGRLLLLPRPLTALMIGGPTGGLRFDVETARDLLAKTQAVVDAHRGSLYITTSRRTPRAVGDWLSATCSASVQLSLYDPDASPEQNPYQGLLALADNFVVTTDSLSMMVEIAGLGRPLALYPLERDAGAIERGITALRLMRPLSAKTDPIPGGGVAARTLAALGRPIHSRDLSAVPRLLVEHGLASWLGESSDRSAHEWAEEAARNADYENDALSRVAARIRALVD